MNKEIRERIIAMVHREVVPAIGCTEPMCVALFTGWFVPKARYLLDSMNIIKI